MSISPNDITDNLPTIAIRSNGKLIPDETAVISLSTSISAGKISTAQLVISDSSNFDVSSSPVFSIGHVIDIFLGYDRNLEPIFSGKIITHNINISSQEKHLAQLLINCQSETVEPSLELSREALLTFTFGDNLMEFSSVTQSDPEGSSDDFTKGKLKSGGSNIAKPGVCIELQELGDRVSGKALVDKVEHLVADGVWMTEMEFIKLPKLNDEDL